MKRKSSPSGLWCIADRKFQIAFLLLASMIIQPASFFAAYLPSPDPSHAGRTNGSQIEGPDRKDLQAAVVPLATTTAVSSSLNPSNTNQAVTFTSTTTSTVLVNTGLVTFSSITTGAVLCSNVSVNGSGVAACTVPANTLTERRHVIEATYAANATFLSSSGSLTQTVNTPTVISVSNTFTNPGGISVPDAGAATSVPYPSNILVSGLGGTITKVALTLTNMNFLSTRDMDFLLVGPGGQKFLFFSDAGGGVVTSGATITLDDTAASALPSFGAIATGTYRPTDIIQDADTFPAPAPAGPYISAAPAGAATFNSVFGGTAPNGTWSLYVADDTAGGGGSTIGSWSLSFMLAPAATTTSVTSSANPSVFGQPVTFTATVTTAGLGTPSGNVQFSDGATPIGGPVALNVSGQAQITTSALSVGPHTITANYAGNVPNGFNSSSGSLAGGQTVNKASTTTTLTSNQSNPVGTGIPVTFTATVSPAAPGSGTRTGTVTFFRNGSPVCSNVTINGSGQATCTVTFSITGNYSISATYSGDSNFNGSPTASPFVQQVLGPTAAGVSVAGRVVSPDGRGVYNARVMMTDSSGQTRYAMTNPFGYYQFTDVTSGADYIFSVTAKGFVSSPGIVRNVTEDITGLDITLQRIE